MKTKSKKRIVSSCLVVFLVSLMVVAAACSGITRLPSVSGEQGTYEQSYITKHETNASDPLQYVDEQYKHKVEGVKNLSAEDYINLIISVGGDSIYTSYEQSGDTISYQDYVGTRNARVQSENIKRGHQEIFKQISKRLECEFMGSITGITNTFTIRIRYGDRDRAEELALKYGAVSTSISEVYELPQTTDANDTNVVNNEVEVYGTGIFDTSDLGYDGTGMLVAVLDSGLDYTHKAFSEENLPNDDDKLRLEKDDVANILKNNSLYAEGKWSTDYPDIFLGRTNLSVDEVFVSKKVPFAYDYADNDTEVNTDWENAHGTHVSGIVVGKSTEWGDEDHIEDGYTSADWGDWRIDPLSGKPITGITGVAPMAQLAFMKVFSDYGNGAELYSIMAALNDCAALGVDVINMSLGIDCGFSDYTDEPELQTAYENLANMGVSIIVSAANSSSSAFGGHYGTNLASNPDSGTVGSPGSMAESLAVASIDGVKTKYIKGPGGVAYFTNSGKADGTMLEFTEDIASAVSGNNIVNGENSSGVDFTEAPYNYYNATTKTYTIPYVVIPGIGDSANYAGRDVKGKIALIQRGTLSFADKLKNARARGAIGAIVYNNVAGKISMSIDTELMRPYDFPSCFIQMDAAKPFIQNAVAGEGVFEISAEQMAGPFMSAFSSWGPLPSLELKPEITGHGGEIYSAYPGGHYSRISGTSMASPNVAGLVTLARQHMNNNAASQSKYDITTNKSLEDRVYQILMSTATQPKDEHGVIYSPRKVGAGLANIKGLINTPAYIYVKDSEGEIRDRTKLELFDDAYRRSLDEEYESGTYEMTFTIKNMESNQLKYEPSVSVITETLSSDGKTVAERGTELAYDAVWSITGNSGYTSGDPIIVDSNAEVEVNLVLTLTPDSIKYIDDTFENGMYVEGFVNLKRLQVASESTDNFCDLSVPYLAFHGDWAKAPIYDYSIYETDADAKNTSMLESEKRYSQGRSIAPFAKYRVGTEDWVVDMGKFVFAYPKAYENVVPSASEDRTTLTLNKEGLFELYIIGGLMRGVKTAEWRILDPITNKVIANGNDRNVRKAGMSGGIGGLTVEADLEDIGCRNNRTYRFEVDMTLDYQYGNPEDLTNTWAFNFTIDTDAPVITNAEVRYELNRNKQYEKYLDIYLADENYVQAMTFDMFNQKTNSYESLFDEGLRPIVGGKNTVSKVTYNLTNAWQFLKDNGFKVKTEIFDYAWNTSYYELDLTQLASQASSINFADTGVYETFTNASGTSTRKVLMGYNDEITYDANGDYKSLDPTVYMRINQNLHLGHALVTIPENIWLEQLTWTSSNPSAVKVNSKTGEIIAVGGGSSTITVTALSGVYKSVLVNVFSDFDASQYSIPSLTNTEHLGFSGVGIDGYSSLVLKAGESENVKIEINPWTFSMNDIVSINWSSSNELVATVSASGEKPLTAQITTKRGTFSNYTDPDKSDQIDPSTYVSNLSNIPATITARVVYNTTAGTREATANFSVVALKEFVVENGTLTEYNGYAEDDEVIIPTNLDIKIIGTKSFRDKDYIKSVVVPEGVHTIEQVAFAYMERLRSVDLPSTIRLIGQGAFAAYEHAIDGLSTSLNVVDTTKFKEPVHIGPAAFQNQRVMGTNMSIVDGKYYIDGVHVDTLSATDFYKTLETVDSKLDTSSFRVIGIQAFYGASWLNGYNGVLDLSSVTSIGSLAFTLTGIDKYFHIGKTDKSGEEIKATEFIFENKAHSGGSKLGTKITLGERSMILCGATELTLPMERIPYMAFTQSFFTERITFTADNVVVEDWAFYESYYKQEETETSSGMEIGLKEVIFEGDVEFIGSEAFINSKMLETLTFDGKVKYISDYAFEGTALKEFKLKDGLEYIGKDAFKDITTLTTLTIAEDFTYELDYLQAFAGCTSLETIEVEGLNSTYSTTIDGKILLNSDETEIIFTVKHTDSLTIPNTVTSIAPYAFAYNKEITSIDLGGVTSISEGAFAGCTKLKSVTASSALTEIDDYAFDGCILLDTITLSTSISQIGDYAFRNTKLDFEGINFNNFTSLTEIGVGAFEGTLIKTFTVPTNVTKISAGLFKNCANLVEVTIHNNVTEIGFESFFATGLEQVEAVGVITIGAFAFANCYDLEEANFENATTIGNSAFAVQSSIIGGKLSETDFSNVTSIESYAFVNQVALNEIDLPKVTSIGSYAFNSSGVETIVFPKVESIGNFAFDNSSLLGDNAGKLVLPKTLEDIGYSAFTRTQIKEFEVDSDNPLYYTTGGVLFKNSPILDSEQDETGETVTQLIQYPSKATATEYSIPEGVVRLDDFSFYGVSNLAKVVMPSSLRYIGDRAFYKASNLKHYTFLSFEAPILETLYSFIEDWVVVDLTTKEEIIESNYDSLYWAVYANFYDSFSVYALDANGNAIGDYIYNTITNKNDQDKLPIQNSSLTGGGFNKSVQEKYGLTMVRPSNGLGYSSFVYSNYFFNIENSSEVANYVTQEINARISALDLTATVDFATATANSKEVYSIREQYNSLTASQQALVQNFNQFKAFELAVGERLNSNNTVTFVSNGVTVATVVVPKNARVDKPIDPTPQEWYTFTGWYLGTNLYNFSYVVSANITLNARFNHSGTTFTVSFEDAQGFEPVIVNAGESLARPSSIPEKEGFTFLGWVVGDEIYDFDSAIVSDITLKALWQNDNEEAGGTDDEPAPCGCGTIFTSNNNPTTLMLISIFGILIVLSSLVLVTKKRGKKSE